MRHLTCFLLLAAASSHAMAICLNPLGCAPTTLEECRQQAARMPTERGVSVAIADCNEKFIYKPKRDYEAGTRALWEVTMERDRPPLTMIMRIAGKPTVISRPHACTAFQDIDKKRHPKACVTYTWGEDVFGTRLYIAEIDQATEVVWSHITYISQRPF